MSGRGLRAVDGDTAVVDVQGTVERVRLLGIDAAERDDEAESVAVIGAMAAERLRGLIEGQDLVLHVQPGARRDRYGRLLAYLHSDAGDVGARLLGEGYVRLYDEFPHPRAQGYRKIAREARTSGRGLWSLSTDSAAIAEMAGMVPVDQAAYVASWKSKVFHGRRCRHAREIAPANAIGFATRDAAVESGRRPCRRCRP